MSGSSMIKVEKKESDRARAQKPEYLRPLHNYSDLTATHQRKFVQPSTTHNLKWARYACRNIHVPRGKQSSSDASGRILDVLARLDLHQFSRSATARECAASTHLFATTQCARGGSQYQHARCSQPRPLRVFPALLGILQPHCQPRTTLTLSTEVAPR